MKASQQNREVHSIADLFGQYSNAIYGYLFRLSGSQALADELTNETFYRAMLALSGFRGDSSVKTWLLRIARNLYLNNQKREKRLTSLDELSEQGVVLSSPHTDLEETVVKQERMESIQHALLMLSETDRSILLLISQENLSYQEISEILEISVPALKVRVFRARQRLAKAIETIRTS